MKILQVMKSKSQIIKIINYEAGTTCGEIVLNQ